MWAGAETWFDHESAHSVYRTFVHVPPENVFDYVSDVTRHPEWTANRMSVTSLTPGPVRVGSRYRTVASQAGREWESIVEITIYERPRVFEFIAMGGATHEPAEAPHRHTFTLTPVTGGTELELHRRSRGLRQRPIMQRLVLQFAASRIGERIVNRLAKNIALGQENLKRRLEERVSA